MGLAIALHAVATGANIVVAGKSHNCIYQ